MSAPMDYEITFAHPKGEKKFRRTASSEALAVEDAQAGYQWRYGTWPGDPVSVTSTSI